MDVWLLWSTYDHEDDRLLAVFASEQAAEEMASRCRAHYAAQPPTPPEFDQWEPGDPRWDTDPLVVEWELANEAWRDACPIQGAWHDTDFAVTCEPVLGPRQDEVGGS